MTPPQFVNTDYDAIVTRLVSRFESITGRTLQPAQVERLVFNAIAYEQKVVLEQMQSAAEQMLLAFSAAPALDYLAELVGVTRLPASAAVTELVFTAVSGGSPAAIPANTRVGTSDGRFIFRTSEEAVFENGTATVSAVATTLGESGNDYLIGEVSQLLDPQPFVASVANTTVTAAGASEETDDELRERVKLAPAQFSVAGPSEAYAFFARQASSAIIDVAVTSTIPGTVEVYPLVAGGVVTPQAILDLVSAGLNDERVRPLSDTVVVQSPAVLNVDVAIELTVYSDADSAAVEAEALQAVAAYLLSRERELGQDIKISQLIALATTSVADVFDVNVVSPTMDVTVSESQIARAASLSVTVTGTSNG